MRARGLVDVLIPRGGASLIRTVVEESTVPVIETGTGNCHVYVDAQADLDMAVEILVNSKAQRPSVCNAAETLLVHRDIADALPAPRPGRARRGRASPCTATRASLAVRRGHPRPPWSRRPPRTGRPSTCRTTSRPRVVDSLDAAVAHIRLWSSGHTEAIVTTSQPAARRFTQLVDSTTVAVNASTRFTDGGQFGFGAEIGISTQKLHARGPMGLPELTSHQVHRHRRRPHPLTRAAGARRLQPVNPRVTGWPRGGTGCRVYAPARRAATTWTVGLPQDRFSEDVGGKPFRRTTTTTGVRTRSSPPWSSTRTSYGRPWSTSPRAVERLLAAARARAEASEAAPRRARPEASADDDPVRLRTGTEISATTPRLRRPTTPVIEAATTAAPARTANTGPLAPPRRLAARPGDGHRRGRPDLHRGLPGRVSSRDEPSAAARRHRPGTGQRSRLLGVRRLLPAGRSGRRPAAPDRNPSDLGENLSELVGSRAFTRARGDLL